MCNIKAFKKATQLDYSFKFLFVIVFIITGPRVGDFLEKVLIFGTPCPGVKHQFFKKINISQSFLDLTTSFKI